MIIHPAEQGTVEWLKARIGIPTASQFHRLITNKTLKPSSQQDGYLSELIAEWIIGAPLQGASSGMMERGKLLESEARPWYEFVRGVTVEQVGLCLRDDRLVGASPDALIGEDGILEIKCPGPKVHVSYLLGHTNLYADHRAQVQGALWITGRKFADLISYHPTMEPVLTNCPRDDHFIAALAEIVDGFVERIRLAKAGFPDRRIDEQAEARA